MSFFVAAWNRNRKDGNRKMNIDIRVMKVANLFIAMTTLGGINVRGGTRGTALEAVQSLFSVLSGNTDDALLAVSLGMLGATLDTAQQIETSEA